jgi:hypothetical protein
MTEIQHFSALGEELARPTPVHKRRRFVGLVKDAKSNQIWDGKRWPSGECQLKGHDPVHYAVCSAVAHR